MNIAIIGCGYAGISAALSISDTHNITIFEQSEKLLPIGAGILLQPLGMKILELYGLGDKAVSIGDQITALEGFNIQNTKILDLQYKKYNPSLFGTGIHRGHLFHALLAKLKEKRVEIRVNEKISQINTEESKCSFISNEKEYKNFDVIIISNGAKSTFRNLLPKFKYQKEYPWGAFWGIFSNRTHAKNILYQRYDGTKKLLGLLPCGKDPETGNSLINLFWSARYTELANIRQQGISTFKSELIKFEPFSKDVVDQITSFDDLLYTTYHDVYCRKWNHKNMVFIGDTIHGMSPQLGIGLNMALFDGYLIGKVINQDNFEVGKLSELKNARSYQNLFYHATSQVLTRFFQSDYKFLGKIRDVVFPFFPNIKVMDQLMINALCGYKTGFTSSMTPDEQIGRFLDKINDR